MSRRCVVLALIAAGCGSNWTIGQNDELIIDCLDERNYFVDVDGDGWGDPNQGGVLQCEPLGDVTATNQRDCDDSDVQVTGRLGSLCPGDLVEGDEDALVGAAVAGEGEFIWLYGSSAAVSYQEARDACSKWAEHPYPANDNPQYGLATFDPSTGSYNDIQQAILEALVDSEGSGTFAAWVGVLWEGDLETGGWAWEDDSSDGLIEDIGFCTDEAPRPEDFFPNMYIDDPDHREIILEELERMRLALVLTDAGDWCLGLPDAASTDSGGPYELTRAHILCERPPGDPAAYEPVDATGADEAT